MMKYSVFLRDFNPRSREGSDGIVHLRTVVSLDISIHAPARGATAYWWTMRCGSEFQSTLPRGERRGVPGRENAGMNFNPRSREGSDDRRTGAENNGQKISIHAPARGATSILSKIHPMFLTISHNASSFSSFPFHSFLPHLLNSSTFCALFQVRISRAFSVYYRFAPKKSTPDL